MVSNKPKLSTIDYVRLITSICKTAISTIGAVITGPFRGNSGPTSYKHHVLFTAMRAYMKYTPTHQLQATTPSTTEAYAAFVKSMSLPFKASTLEDGSTAYWLGHKAADTVLLFFHGGGYAMPATVAHFQLLSDLQGQATSQNSSLSVLILEYGLAPSAQYPSQLKQATYAYKYLTETRKLPPSRILLAGDSAGGHLALGLLSHLAHPHPELPTTNATDPIAGTILISPWVTFVTNSPSMSKNLYKDCLDIGTLQKWSKAFIGNAPMDNYTVPLNAEPAWWSGLKTKVLCIVAGGTELFFDDIENFATKVKVHHPEVEFFNSPGEAHDSPISDIVMGFKEGAAARKFCQWILTTIKK
ncbi:uncharacterized protein Z518_04678 [Rhinocladiella mackenziei CBS 650.93]|uniref:Rhinocladiella mackenziei CBS 650.93 unplaced genomic scaffold supercont1.3, whole genome shotgun sequence n=1 Tax=Rhinocladiella mackenziei CBS 650.93 TaxID=1442369 RepID=A0A0D2FWQ9_9EURO|nr:uncharacterized protein Z518_04678 [Rhinocladiella mackenziei CBS 650.93]KIX06702.1 hypothetical protein Z518_04678 [Rhinocladiella mackenziei CBS 650.93]